MLERLAGLLVKLHRNMGKDQQNNLHVFVGEKQSQKELDHSLVFWGSSCCASIASSRLFSS